MAKPLTGSSCIEGLVNDCRIAKQWRHVVRRSLANKKLLSMSLAAIQRINCTGPFAVRTLHEVLGLGVLDLLKAEVQGTRQRS